MIETLITSSALIAGICLLRLFLKGRSVPEYSMEFGLQWHCAL